MNLPANTHMYEFLIVVLVFLLLMMNALATFVPRYTRRVTKLKCEYDADRKIYLSHTRFTGLFSGGKPLLHRHQYVV